MKNRVDLVLADNACEQNLVEQIAFDVGGQRLNIGRERTQIHR